jgi:hypothetical protein
VSKRGMVTTYAGGGGVMGGDAQLNDNQTFTLRVTEVGLAALPRCMQCAGLLRVMDALHKQALGVM